MSPVSCHTVLAPRLVVLGDPLATKTDRARYIRKFVEAAASPFTQLEKVTAGVLAKFGYRIKQIGVDTHIRFDSHSFAGKRNQTVRYSERWLINQATRYAVAQRHKRSRSNRFPKRALRSYRQPTRNVLPNRPFLADLSPPTCRFVIMNPLGTWPWSHISGPRRYDDDPASRRYLPTVLDI